MADKTKAAPHNIGTTHKQDTDNTSSSRPQKILLAMLHYLENPQGVTEKSINTASGLMSGRNVPTKLQKRNRIMLAPDLPRRIAPDGSRYKVYLMRDSHEARKLAALIIWHSRRYGLTPPAKGRLAALAAAWPDRSAAKQAA